MDLKEVSEKFKIILENKNCNKFIIDKINLYKLNDYDVLEKSNKENEKNFYTFLCKTTDYMRFNTKIKKTPEPYYYYNIDDCKRIIKFNLDSIIEYLNIN
jgi:hypothetical protein